MQMNLRSKCWNQNYANVREVLEFKNHTTYKGDPLRQPQAILRPRDVCIDVFLLVLWMHFY